MTELEKAKSVRIKCVENAQKFMGEWLFELTQMDDANCCDNVAFLAELLKTEKERLK